MRLKKVDIVLPFAIITSFNVQTNEHLLMNTAIICERNVQLHVTRILNNFCYNDRLCGLVVRVSGYRYRGLGFDSRRYQIF